MILNLSSLRRAAKLQHSIRITRLPQPLYKHNQYGNCVVHWNCETEIAAYQAFSIRLSASFSPIYVRRVDSGFSIYLYALLVKCA
jgi:hypothetical protein